MSSPWPALDQVCSELGFHRDAEGIWRGELDGIAVTGEYVPLRWGIVRIHAHIDPSLGIDLRLARQADSPAESLELFRITSNDPARGRAILDATGDAILAATHTHHWVSVIDRWVMLSGYGRADAERVVRYARDTPERIRQSFEQATSIARRASAASAQLGPVAVHEPPPSPRAAPALVSGAMKGITIAFLLLGLIGFVVIGAALASGEARVLVSMSLAGASMTGVCWLVAMLAAIVWARRVRLYAHGTPALAKVTHTKRINRWDWGHRVWKLDYVFRGPSGEPIAGTWQTVNPPDVGDELWVIHHPHDPRRSIPAKP